MKKYSNKEIARRLKDVAFQGYSNAAMAENLIEIATQLEQEEKEMLKKVDTKITELNESTTFSFNVQPENAVDVIMYTDVNGVTHQSLDLGKTWTEVHNPKPKKQKLEKLGYKTVHADSAVEASGKMFGELYEKVDEIIDYINNRIEKEGE